MGRIRGLDGVVYDSLEELEVQEGPLQPFDVQNDRLGDVPFVFSGFEEGVPCGITGCGQTPHKGYIVRKADGAIAVSGHVCGYRHMGLDFHALQKGLDRALEEEDKRDWFRANRKDFFHTADYLQDLLQGHRNLHSQRRQFSRRHPRLAQALRERYKNGNHFASDAGKTYRIRGLAVWAEPSWNDIRRHTLRLREWAYADPEQLTLPELRKVKKALGTSQEFAGQLQEWAHGFDEFFQQENLKAFEAISEVPPKDRAAFVAQGWDPVAMEPVREPRSEEARKIEKQWLDAYEKYRRQAS